VTDLSKLTIAGSAGPSAVELAAFSAESPGEFTLPAWLAIGALIISILVLLRRRQRVLAQS